jgi:hypothetical protein
MMSLKGKTMKYTCLLFATIVGVSLMAPPLLAAQSLVAKKVTQAPVVDGVGNDPAWSGSKSVTVRDPIAGQDVTINAVYTDDEIFIRASFHDETKEITHKTLAWDKAAKKYRTGPDREDAFIMKWSMDGDVADLSLSADIPYQADIWYWKAHRTDHAGYADDKRHVYSLFTIPKAKKRISKGGRIFYLIRPGDKGKAAYGAKTVIEFSGNRVSKFTFNKPEGSRADVRAKGQWRDNTWTVELSRKLDTGHDDDVRFKTSDTYPFGVSLYEIAGRKVNPKMVKPLFGSGEVGETLTLSFE